jgi:hypothetical protein
MIMSPESHLLGFANVHLMSLMRGPMAEELLMMQSDCWCQFYVNVQGLMYCSLCFPLLPLRMAHGIYIVAAFQHAVTVF